MPTQAFIHTVAHSQPRSTAHVMNSAAQNNAHRHAEGGNCQLPPLRLNVSLRAQSHPTAVTTTRLSATPSMRTTDRCDIDGMPHDAEAEVSCRRSAARDPRTPLVRRPAAPPSRHPRTSSSPIPVHWAASRWPLPGPSGGLSSCSRSQASVWVRARGCLCVLCACLHAYITAFPPKLTHRVAQP